ncbi:MAG: F0F1 ATP synthase subunit alpha [Candidatus Margulisiibacteriota bacterium]
MLKPSEISEALRKEIEGYEGLSEISEQGFVASAGDGVASVYGLENVMSMELLEFSSGPIGIALSLLSDSVGVIILRDAEKVKEGDSVKRTGKVVSVPVGDALLGRIVNPLGEALDGGPCIISDKERPIEIVAPSVIDRAPVNRPLQTGLKAVDSMIPIGRGQRELIIGDRGVGKTAIAIDAILNQKKSGVRCFYVAIGQKTSLVAKIYDILKSRGAMEYTTIVFASPTDSPSLQYIAPYAGCAMAEEYLYKGDNALVIYDDLSKHAVAYRQLSLLLRRPPGREAYPGDIFYLHSRLLERASKLSEEKGGGSLTALPIVETQAGDISSYIPTNIISITDGQIYLENDLFNSGIRPAVNVGLSVSRVGGSAQIKAMKKVAGSLRLDLAQYRELAAFAQFTSDLDKSSQRQLDRGQRLTEILKQDQYVPMDVSWQVISIYCGTTGHLDDLKAEQIVDFEKGLLEFVRSNYCEVADDIEKKEVLEEWAEKRLEEAVENYKKLFLSGKGTK